MLSAVPVGTTWAAGGFPPEDPLHARGPDGAEDFIRNGKA